jgi:hypothetical protein
MIRQTALALAIVSLVAACEQQDFVLPEHRSVPAIIEPLDAPPTEGGLYVDTGACPGEGCYFGRFQMINGAELYDWPGKSPAVVGQVNAGEWVDTIQTEDRFAPVKGVMVADLDPFLKGETVWRLGYEGEGCFSVWGSGKQGGWCDLNGIEPSAILWDEVEPVTDGSEGFWVQVTRESGPGGWLREPMDLRCAGVMDRDADCPELN